MRIVITGIAVQDIAVYAIMYVKGFFLFYHNTFKVNYNTKVN